MYPNKRYARDTRIPPTIKHRLFSHFPSTRGNYKVKSRSKLLLVALLFAVYPDRPIGGKSLMKERLELGIPARNPQWGEQWITRILPVKHRAVADASAATNARIIDSIRLWNQCALSFELGKTTKIVWSHTITSLVLAPEGSRAVFQSCRLILGCSY